MLRSVNLPIRDINKCKKEYEIEDGSFLDTSICAGEESYDNLKEKNACKVRFNPWYLSPEASEGLVLSMTIVGYTLHTTYS